MVNCYYYECGHLLVTKQTNEHLEIWNDLFTKSSTGAELSLQMTNPQVYVSYSYNCHRIKLKRRDFSKYFLYFNT